jgi:hypothetical protein
VRRPAGWSEATHASSVQPDYARLFDANVVHSLEIAIAPSDYAAMQSNLEELLGESGRQRRDGRPYHDQLGRGV